MSWSQALRQEEKGGEVIEIFWGLTGHGWEEEKQSRMNVVPNHRDTKIFMSTVCHFCPRMLYG